MDRSLDSLSTPFRALVERVLAKLVERGVMVMIVQTGRTPEEQKQNVLHGTSRTRLSKHLPRRLRGLVEEPNASDAIDLCPYETYQIHGPDKLAWVERSTPESVAAFQAVGDIGEALGLRWGGRWGDPHDPGHLELLFDGERYRDVPRASTAWAEHGVS